MRLGHVTVAWAVVALVSCNSSSGPPKQPGELGRGVFSYSCGPGADAQCNQNADLAPLDQSTNLPPVAVGAVFGITFAMNPATAGDQPNPGHTKAVATSFVDVGGANLFTAKRAGYTAIIGYAGVPIEANEEAVDLVHTHLAAIDHIEFAQSSAMGGNFQNEVTVAGLAVNVTVSGSPVTQLFRVVPVTPDHKLLAGALPVMWTSSDPTTAPITTDPTQNIITVQFNSAGTVTLHATLASFSGDVTVTVGS